VAFKEIPENNLMDFLPSINRNEIHILKAWKNHFISCQVPFAVTSAEREYKKGERVVYETIYTLWKERRVGDERS